jgi:hypothetical protein
MVDEDPERKSHMKNVLIKKFRFIDNGLAGDVYYPDPSYGVEPTSAGIFLYGFPFFTGPNEVTTALVSAGMTSFQPHYYGSYDSNGVFSPSSLIETCTVSQTLFDRGYVTKVPDGKQSPLKSKLELCIGHSFGTFAAIRAARYFHSLKVLVLLAPTIHYRHQDPDMGVNEDGLENLEFVRITNPYTYRLATTNEWSDVLTGKDPIPSLPDHPTLEEVIVVVGERDKYFNHQVFEKMIPSIVRGYCGKRAKFTFMRLPNVAHAINSGLIDKGNGFDLAAVLKKHGMTKKLS